LRAVKGTHACYNSEPLQALQGLVNLGQIASQEASHCNTIFDNVSKISPNIFAGATMPVTSALMHLSGDRIQPIDLIHGHDLLDDEVFESVLLLASIGAALAAPILQ